MTLNNLVKELAAEIREAVKDYVLVAENEPDKKVSVYENNLPNNDFENDTFYPFVIVEFLNVEDTAQASTAAVLITVGCYTGIRRDERTDLLNICETIRQYLLGHRVIGRRFLMELPLYTAVVEKRSEFFEYANIFAAYKMPQSINKVV